MGTSGRLLDFRGEVGAGDVIWGALGFSTDREMSEDEPLRHANTSCNMFHRYLFNCKQQGSLKETYLRTMASSVVGKMTVTSL